MAIQREKAFVVTPFTNYLRSRGWHCENLHGNAFQQGLPDQVCFRRGKTIFIEYKVIEDNLTIRCTDAQKKKFPVLIANGALIYVIAARNLSGHDSQTVKEIAHLYKSVLVDNEPNGYKLFVKELWSTLNPFCQRKISK